MLFTWKQGVGPTSEQGLYLFDLDQRPPTMIPGSGGLISGRWSPDGHFLAAVSVDQSAITLLDLGKHRWTEIARGAAISSPVWLGRFRVVFSGYSGTLRTCLPLLAWQRCCAAYSFEDILLTGVMRCAFWGFAPDGSWLVQVNRGGGDIHAVTVNLPCGKTLSVWTHRAARLPLLRSPQTAHLAHLAPHLLPPVFDAGGTRVIVRGAACILVISQP